MKIRCSTNQNTSKSIKAAELSQRSLQKKGRNRYTIRYSEVYNAPDADPREMFHEFKAQISVSNPYDDADYVWATISNGVVNYVKNGKVIDKSYYMDADDIDVENDEWCDVVIEQVLENLESYNSKVESRIIHSSSDIRSKTQDNEYWFFTRHGVQPGSVPKDVEILDIIDTPNGTFVKLNRFLSTKELNYYDMIEKAPEGITSAEDIEDDDTYSSTTSDIILKLKEELKSAVTDTMLSEELGFYENEVEQYSAVDVYVKDNNIVCEIRAEVSYDGLMELCDKCNLVVEKYYKDAYFDPEEPGIATAYIPIDDVTGAITAMEDSMIDPPDYEEPDVFDEEFELEIDLTGVVVKVEDDTLDLDESSIEITPDSGDDDFVNDYGMYIDDVSGVEEKILDLVQKDIPDAEGRYKLSGYAYLIYNVEGLEMYKERYGEDDFDETVYTDRAKKSYDASKSYTKNLTVRKMI